LVERNLAKVEVAGSSLVFRSKKIPPTQGGIFCFSPCGGTGRREGLKIPSYASGVQVQFLSGAQFLVYSLRPALAAGFLVRQYQLPIPDNSQVICLYRLRGSIPEWSTDRERLSLIEIKGSM
jgi:hypothetical protein